MPCHGCKLDLLVHGFGELFMIDRLFDQKEQLMLQEGRVVEVGDHQHLMQKDGLYAEMWTRQAESSRVGTDQTVNDSLPQDAESVHQNNGEEHNSNGHHHHI